MTYLSLFLFVATVGLLYILRNETLSRGKLEEDEKIAEENNEILSNRPVTDDDLMRSLRDKAANGCKGKDKP